MFPLVGTSNSTDRLPQWNCKVITTRCSVSTGSGNTGFISALNKGMDNSKAYTSAGNTPGFPSKTQNTTKFFHMSFLAGNFTPFRVSSQERGWFDPNGQLKDFSNELVAASSSRQENLVLYMLLRTRISVSHKPSESITVMHNPGFKRESYKT